MPHPGLLELFSKSGSAEKVLGAFSSGRVPILLAGAQGYARTFYLAAVFEKTSKSMAVICSNPEEALTMHRDLGELLGHDRVLLFPASEVMPFETKGITESLWMRVSCLSRLLKSGEAGGRAHLVVMPSTALLRKLMPARVFEDGCLTLQKGIKVPPHELAAKLISYGYDRVSSVETKGELAVRGGLIDVFPAAAESPYRLEFFYDEIDSIRVFDPETQVSTHMVESAFLIPAEDSCFVSRCDGVALDSPGSTVLEYFPHFPLLAVDNLTKCLDTMREFEQMGTEIASARIVAGTMKSEDASVYFPVSAVEPRLADVSIAFAPFVGGPKGFAPKEVVETDTTMQISFAGRWQDMMDEVKQQMRERRRVVVLAGNRERRDVLKRWLAKEDVWADCQKSITGEPALGVLTLSLGSGEGGFNCDSLALSVFTETEVYGKTKVRRDRQAKPRKKVALDWRELSPGDYVVHVNHGVARFMGISNMTVNGATRDYLCLKYAADDALYVPTDQVGLVEKYVGPEGSRPPLQRLGSGEWQRIKARVRQSVEDMARKLLMLEATRKSKKGYAFSEDGPWQKQFEEGFEYEDTDDQAAATQEIKVDMEKMYPMDRLLCGDVGYGKTEVAMRAAFKAVMDSKQVAILVPTTVLAEQHYATFIRRFSDYPVSIQALSRFRSAAEQKSILGDVARGLVDILIGTHRLLSKDVGFSDLGLLIIDEEHRFGVAQKERLKHLAETCDVLTLTATPIPRTLNMALTGIRDASLMETPPEGRFPVETYVIPYNASLVSQAIRREIRRGGQVFYVHNRVHSISSAVQRVQSCVPEARIAVGHGRMREQLLASTMQDFLLGRFDVLISTTIIESGLDLPNVNTLIVEEADKLGLAQLYQLRGRVGRSNKVAYAYFTFRPGRNLTPDAELRLTALRDFAAMGSGYKLALKDLEIRGAGNLLGAEQHGFMTLVGYDMYIRLLEKAVNTLRGEKEEESAAIQTSIEIPCDAYLPDSYVESSKERFSFYKRVAGVSSVEGLSDLESELLDRYGAIPEQAQNLLDVARLKVMCSLLGVTQVSFATVDLVLGKQQLSFRIEVPHVFPFHKTQSIHRTFPGLIFDSRASALTLVLSQKDPRDALRLGIRLAEELLLG